MRPSLRQKHLCYCSALAVAFLLSAELTAQEKVRSDQRLPPGVLMYVSTPDIPASYDAFRNTPYGKLINGPELEEFRLQLLEKFEEGAAQRDQIEEQLGMPLSDLAVLASGEASLAVIRPLGQPLGAVAFLEYGDHQDVIDQLLEFSEAMISGQTGQRKQTEEYNGTDIHYYSIDTPHPEYKTIDVAWTIKDGQFVIASSRPLIESVLDLWDGKGDQTFAQDEVYSAIMKRCATTDGSVPDTIWYVDPINLVTAALNLIPQPEVRMVTGMLPLYLPMLGLNRLEAFGSTLELDGDQFSMATRSMIYVNQPASGVLKIFEMRASIEQPAAWVPDSAGQYFGVDWNVAGAYGAVEATYDGFLGPGAFDRQMTDLTKQANQNNLHLKDDVVNMLTGKFEGYMAAPGDDDRITPDFAGAFGVTDEEKAWRLLELIVAESAGDVQEHQIGGKKAYTALTPDDVQIAVSVANKQILVASGLGLLQAMMSGKPAENPLAESNKYKVAKAQIPDQVSVLTYQSPASQLRVPYEKLRNGEFDAATEGQFDFSVLPPFEQIAMYFVPSFGFFAPDKNGAYSVQFGLKMAE